MNENYLIHYGKKGMKWGVRHDPQKSSSGSKRSAKQISNKKSKASLKQKVQAKLSKIDKQKVKHVAKAGALIAAGTAAFATLGVSGLSYVSYAYNASRMLGPYPSRVTTVTGTTTFEGKSPIPHEYKIYRGSKYGHF